MKSITLKRVAMWSLVFLTMLAIFLFSAQEGTESSKLSDKVMSAIEGGSSQSSQVTSSETSPTPSSPAPKPSNEDHLIKITILRKSAHIAIFAALGFFMMGAISLYKGKWYFHAPLSLLLCTLYAASDEWHQTFVVGRVGKMSDVGIDIFGILIGVLLMLLLISFIKKFTKASAS